MNLKQRKEALREEVRSIAMKAKTEQDGVFTSDQLTIVNAKMAEIDHVSQLIKAADESKSIMDSITALHPDANSDSRSKARPKEGYLTFRGLVDSVKALKAEAGTPYHVKALLGVGTDLIPAQVVTQSPIEMGRRATSLLDVLPVKVIEGDQWTYLRQVARVNNAAPVAVGATKPQSTYTLERVTGRLEVVAHTSEPIHEYWLADEESLSGFISDEMGYGIQLAVENQTMLGDGVRPNLTGLLTTSGIQTQAFNSTAIRTVRSGITKVENLGYEAVAVVLNPLDWEAIETTVTSTGEYLLEADGTPIDRKSRRLWGVPVVVSPAVSQGTGVLIAGGAAVLATDGQVSLAWGRVNDDFTKNQIRARAEGRFGVQVNRPDGIVKLTLAGV